MPIYSYKCNDCQKVEDQHRDVDERNRIDGCECGGVLRRKFQAAGFSVEGKAYIYQGDPNSWFD